MANEFGAADLEPHLIYGLTVHYYLDWATAAGTFTVLSGGYHSKMRLRNVWVEVKAAALNATEPVINIQHGGNEVVSTFDCATIGATAAIGTAYLLTIVDAYKDLDAGDSLQIQVESADGGASTRGWLTFEYELVA